MILSKMKLRPAIGNTNVIKTSTLKRPARFAQGWK